MPETKRLFDEYDADTLGRVWQSIPKSYFEVLGTLGRDDFEVGH